MNKIIGIYGVENGEEKVVRRTNQIWILEGWRPPKWPHTEMEVFALYEDAKKAFDKRVSEAKRIKHSCLDFEENISNEPGYAYVSFKQYGNYKHITLKNEYIK